MSVYPPTCQTRPCERGNLVSNSRIVEACLFHHLQASDLRVSMREKFIKCHYVFHILYIILVQYQFQAPPSQWQICRPHVPTFHVPWHWSPILLLTTCRDFRTARLKRSTFMGGGGRYSRPPMWWKYHHLPWSRQHLRSRPQRLWPMGGSSSAPQHLRGHIITAAVGQIMVSFNSTSSSKLFMPEQIHQSNKAGENSLHTGLLQIQNNRLDPQATFPPTGVFGEVSSVRSCRLRWDKKHDELLFVMTRKRKYNIICKTILFLIWRRKTVFRHYTNLDCRLALGQRASFIKQYSIDLVR